MSIGLTPEQIEGSYFRLYYQFVKHSFGLMYRPQGSAPAKLRLYFDEFPDTREGASQFKGFILALRENFHVRNAGLTIASEDIAEIRSHDHVLAQCLDVVLGAMAFRLNDKHKEMPIGKHRRGKRTVAKEKVYKAILKEIRKIRPNFNIGVSTGIIGGLEERWQAAYQHWNFRPSEAEFRKEFVNRKRKKVAPPNLHESLTQGVRLRLNQSRLEYACKFTRAQHEFHKLIVVMKNGAMLSRADWLR